MSDSLNKNNINNIDNENDKNDNSETLKDRLEQYILKDSLKENIKLFEDNIFKDDDTVIYRKVRNRYSLIKFCLVFIDDMIDSEFISENIIYSLINCKLSSNTDEFINYLKYLKEQVLTVDDIKETSNIDEIVSSALYGDCIIFIDGIDKALIISCEGYETRSISEPPSETIIHGPREGFNESLDTNISLIRKRINSPHLKFKIKEIGVRTRTKFCLVYIDDIVNPKILKELENRLNKIDIEGIFSPESIIELIKDRPLSPFKTIGNTERPDIIASKLLQGRIAILCDGSPTSLTLPFLFIEYFQVNEDYYENFIYASFNRLLRLMAFIITIATPGIFVATIAFHKEMIPTRLALSIYLARENVPLPLAIEALIMIIIFEILREAGIRLPKHIGATVSIVGALILGEAAVSAKFISAPMVIIIAITGICELILYQMRTAVLVIRFLLLLNASLLGLYGIIFSSMGLTIYLLSIKSFGIPYMLKLVDFDKYNIRDTNIRAPWFLLKYRTKFISKNNIRLKNYIHENDKRK